VQKTLHELAVLMKGKVIGDGAVISPSRGIEEAEKGDRLLSPSEISEKNKAIRFGNPGVSRNGISR